MEREGPNVRPARLDFPESGGGWAILGISYDALLHARWLRARCEDADGEDVCHGRFRRDLSHFLFVCGVVRGDQAGGRAQHALDRGAAPRH